MGEAMIHRKPIHKRLFSLVFALLAALLLAGCGGDGSSAVPVGGGDPFALVPLSIMSRSGTARSPDGTWSIGCFLNPDTAFDEMETVIISVNDYDSTRTQFFTSSNGTCGGSPTVSTSFILSVAAGDFDFDWGNGGGGTVAAPTAAGGGALPDPATGTKIAIAVFNFPSDSWFIDDSTATWRLYRGDIPGCGTTADLFPLCLFAPRFLTKQ